MRKNILACFLLPACLLFSREPVKAQQTTVYNVKDYGAKGNGVDADTKAIDSAIAVAAKNGGGTVLLPAGNYLSATIHLQSHIVLYLGPGATLIAASKGYGNPEPNSNSSFQDYGHSHFNNSLIVGDGLEDISICGPGHIWGKGLLRDSVSNGAENGLGNKAISLKKCHNVKLSDFSILHGGWFAALLNNVDNLTIDNLKIDTQRDGLDVISCKNVNISNCVVNSPQDDAICLKSDFALGYARPTENVMITNCMVSGYDEGTMLDGTFQLIKRSNRTGRIKLGTESNGGFRNIAITNCLFDYSRGLALETVDGGILEDVTISNITMRHIVNSPLFIRLGERMRAPKGTADGALRRVLISNITAYDVVPAAALILGTKKHAVEDITLTNIRFYYTGGGTADMRSVNVPELDRDYPEPSRFGRTPSYGFFIRHVKGLHLSNIQTSFGAADQRYAYILDDVQNVGLDNVGGQLAQQKSFLRLTNVKNINIRNCSPVKDVLLEDAGEETY